MALDLTALRASVDGAKAHMGDLGEKLVAALEAAKEPQIVEVEKIVEVPIVEFVTDPADQAAVDAMAAELSAAFPVEPTPAPEPAPEPVAEPAPEAAPENVPENPQA